MALQAAILSPAPIAAGPSRAAIERGALGVVAIGRNEGERLRACLTSARAGMPLAAVVYVDSGSTDASVSMARAMGVEVVELDMAVGFTAARARNEGLDKLLGTTPGLEFVQFVDGDCELAEGWLTKGMNLMAERADVGLACGRRRERFVEASIYNRLCDIEWDTPPGQTTWCGGDSLVRVAAILQAGKFNASLIAGEEPELCLRLMRHGWKIVRLDAEMTRHDAAIKRFGQWWKRGVRAGHAFAEGAAMHGGQAERFCVRPVMSGWFWGAVLPVAALAGAWGTRGVSLGLLLLYPLLGGRIFVAAMRRGLGMGVSMQYAFFSVLGKFAQAVGQMKFVFTRMIGKRSALIEYKSGTQ